MIVPVQRKDITGGDASSFAAAGVARDNDLVTVWQRPLPLPWRRAPAPDATGFAHPAERELARILTFHGVRWVYEPTTFVLERGEDGEPTLCFNPDFYLPEHGRYLELTTMRQAHVTRKNRKLRLLRERYPSVDVQCLYRRDFARLADRWRILSPNGALAAGDTLFAEPEIDRRVDEIADDLVGTEPPDLVLTLGAGARRFATELTVAMFARGVRPELTELRLAGSEPTSLARRLRVMRGPRREVRRRRILIVTDVVSTGLTTDFAVRWLRGRGVADVQVATLLDRPAARFVTVPIRAAAFTVEDQIVAGHGVRAGGDFADLPDLIEVHRLR